MNTFIVNDRAANIALAKRVIRYFAPYKWLVAFSMLCLALVAATTAGTAWLIRPALDEIFIKKDETALVLVPIAYIFLVLFKGAARYGQSLCMTYSGLHVLRKVRGELFEKILSLPLRHFDTFNVGALMSHITNDVGMIQRCLPAVLMIFRQSLTMVGLLVVVFYQNFQLALAAIVILPLAGLPLLWFSRRLRSYGRRGAQVNADMTTLIQELFSGIRVIKAFATERSSAKRFDVENARQQRLALHQNMVSDLSSPSMEFISAFGIGIIIWYGGGQVIEGSMTTGAFFSFVAALIMLYDPFKSLNSAMMDLQNALAGAERVFGLLDSPVLNPEKGGEAQLDEPFEELVFDNVTFGYASEEEPALRNASLSVRKGERIALVGPSGAGKTTFVNLIPRFYEAQEGEIRINGRPLAAYDLASLRRNIALVSQDAFLFNITVRDNIMYGHPEASEETMLMAAKAAFVDQFVADLPQGFDTFLGERGTRLSGGQKQRVTIARALVKNAPLLILDEATSALDSESESVVQKALDNLMIGRTSIVIAHRLSTVLNSDRILVLDKGRIVDSGSHAELLERCELYQRLCELQFGQRH